jgi:uncharacterized protein (TIRG00374 family)
VNGRTLRFLVPFAISAALLVLLVRTLGEEAAQLPAALAAADWRLIPPAIALYFVGVWLRSIRWGMLLPAYHLRTWVLFQALVVGFTVNNLLPLRMGEVARCYLLARWCKVPYGATVASLLVERVLDGLSLAMLLLLAIAVLPAPEYLPVGIIAALGFLSGALLLALAAWRESTAMSLEGWVVKRLPPKLAAVTDRLAVNFIQSLTLVHSPARLIRLLGLSLLAWCFELGLFFMYLVSFGMPAKYPLALLVGAAGNFATLLPSSPGYAGTFDGVVVKVLHDSAGVTTAQAFAYDLAVHMTLIVPVVALGILVLWRSNITFGQVTRSSPERATAPASPALRS